MHKNPLYLCTFHLFVAKQLRISLVTKVNNDFSQLLAMANLVS